MSLSATTMACCNLSKGKRFAMIGQPHMGTPEQEPEEADEGVVVWESDLDDCSLQSLVRDNTPSFSFSFTDDEQEESDESKSAIRLPHLRQKSSSLTSFLDFNDEEKDEVNDEASNLRRPHFRHRQSSLASYQEEDEDEEEEKEDKEKEKMSDVVCNVACDDDEQSNERCPHFRQGQSSIASSDSEGEDEVADETTDLARCKDTESTMRAFHYREKMSTLESSTSVDSEFEQEGSSTAWFWLCCIVVFFSASSLMSGSMSALMGSVVPAELSTILTALIVLSVGPCVLTGSNSNIGTTPSTHGPFQFILFLTIISFLFVWCMLFVYYGATAKSAHHVAPSFAPVAATEMRHEKGGSGSFYKLLATLSGLSVE